MPCGLPGLLKGTYHISDISLEQVIGGPVTVVQTKPIPI